MGDTLIMNRHAAKVSPLYSLEIGAGDSAASVSKIAPSISVSEEDGPVQIIEALEGHSFALREDVLASILLRPEVADKKVSVVSVAGAFRKGKSFLLNFLLRFMQQKGWEPSTDWLGSDDQKLSGFRWRGGCERETSGILLWKDPFLVKLPSGEEIVVLLMDTQGAFDSQSIVKDCATIFALSSMVSSFQIYNLSQNIQEDDLQHLQLFTEYGRLAIDQTASKPFQSLLFLVRDWSYPYEAEYGFLGGDRILERRLQVNDNQHHELQQLRKHIKACFDNTQCFLMPHPGLKVATSPSFVGQLKEIEEEFKQQLRCLMPRLLSPEQLVLKQINGEWVTCRELMEYFKAYIMIFQGEELPEPRSMLLATAEANNLAAVASSKAHYCKQMDDVCGGDQPFLASDDLATEHDRARDESLEQFLTTKKMGGDEYSESFLKRLDDEIVDSYENYVKLNNAKNLFKSFRTPAVLFVVLVILYVLQEVFQFVSLDTFAVTCSTMVMITLATIVLWAYTRYSGNFREAGEAIDELSETIWQHILSPASSYAMSEGVKHAAIIQRKLSEAPGNQTNKTRTGSAYGSMRHRYTRREE